ncbi:MAG: hypothetical protein IJR85_04220 [Synergistaceae bacterium]|nr:hypothetical protein [Synergistaceae bacterium]
MKRNFLWLVVVLVFWAAVSVGGCGGSSSSGGSDTANENVVNNPDDEDYGGRNDFEDPVFETLSGQWTLDQYNIQVIYSFPMNLSGTHEANKDTISAPGTNFRIKAYGNGTLALAAFDAGKNPTSFTFEPISAEFFKQTYPFESVGRLNLIMPAVYTYKGKGSEGKGYVYQATGYDGNTYTLEFELNSDELYFFNERKDQNAEYTVAGCLVNVSHD